MGSVKGLVPFTQVSAYISGLLAKVDHKLKTNSILIEKLSFQWPRRQCLPRDLIEVVLFPFRFRWFQYCIVLCSEFESLFQMRYRFLSYFDTLRSPFSTTLSLDAKYKIYRLAWEKALSTISGLYSVVGGEEGERRLSPNPFHKPRDKA